MQTTKLTITVDEKKRTIPAEEVAPGIAIAKRTTTQWRNGMRVRVLDQKEYWVYHIPSGRPITTLDLLRDQALELAQVFGSWEDIDWTQDALGLAQVEGLRARVGAEVEKRLPKWPRED
jgi:hypothetical protein